MASERASAEGSAERSVEASSPSARPMEPEAREALSRAAASRCLLFARRRFQEEADRICDECHSRSMRAAARANTDVLIATAAPQARVLVAPNWQEWKSARRGAPLFFHELTFLAVRRLPPHRTAFHAFRALAARRALSESDVGGVPVAGGDDLGFE